MAGGKLSPRQKMINMMYLVLTALLALNVSKDILEAFTKLNESLDKSVETLEAKNDEIYAKFAAAMADNPEKVRPYKEKAEKVEAEADKLHELIAKMKDDIIVASGGYEEGSETIPAKLDALEDPANYLLNQGNGEKLKKEIDEFEKLMINYAGENEGLKKQIDKTFDTSPQKVGDKKVPWQNAQFEHYPLGAIVPFLTNIQSKVRTTESDVISHLSAAIGESDLKFTNVQVMVVPKSNYVTQGGEYEAEVFLAAYDATQEPEILVEGEPLPAEEIKNGRGHVKFQASNVGEVTWGGKITITQIGKGEKTYDIPEQSFTVAPKSVVISPTKMNVLYRGVQNPLEIGVPGVAPERISASGPGVRKTGKGEYVADVTKVSGKDVTISVTVDEVDEEGKVTGKRPAGSKEFRIKGLPPAVGMIYGQSTSMRSASAVKAATVEAEFRDFPFDLPLTVTSFEIAIPGFPPERINGNKLTGGIKTKIDQLKPGASITIRNIKARGPGGIRVTDVGNISVDVN